MHTFGRVSANGQWIVLDPITTTRYKSCIQEKAGPMIWPSSFFEATYHAILRKLSVWLLRDGLLRECVTIQILTRTVMKYVSVECQESYIFPRDYIFLKCAALRENISILAPPTRDISTVPVDICYIRWSKLMISSKYFVLYDYHEVW